MKLPDQLARFFVAAACVASLIGCVPGMSGNEIDSMVNGIVGIVGGMLLVGAILFVLIGVFVGWLISILARSLFSSSREIVVPAPIFIEPAPVPVERTAKLHLADLDNLQVRTKLLAALRQLGGTASEALLRVEVGAHDSKTGDRQQATGNRKLQRVADIAHRLLAVAVDSPDRAARLPKDVAEGRCRRTLPKDVAGRHIAGQWIRSATSAGANYEEARAAGSRTDFVHLGYWIELALKARLLAPESTALLDEGHQLAAT